MLDSVRHMAMEICTACYWAILTVSISKIVVERFFTFLKTELTLIRITFKDLSFNTVDVQYVDKWIKLCHMSAIAMANEYIYYQKPTRSINYGSVYDRNGRGIWNITSEATKTFYDMLWTPWQLMPYQGTTTQKAMVSIYIFRNVST